MIYTERYLVENISESDRIDLERLFTNSHTRKYLGGVVKIEDLNNKINKIIENSKNVCYLKVMLKDTREFIGLLYLDMHYNGEDKELSYEFLPQYFGKGYAFESINEVLKYFFLKYKISRILAETQVNNKRSIKLLEKLGFTFIKNLERFGEVQVIFMIYREDFLGAKG